ncbi:hypothetical protein [Halomarina pelagica]|uniref:hypothetical protein n=1 Tax=Halomarina pelagica TaxID=2961599 RepID=UPI0020C1F388|nr:hypothetical protein [Halomarina sp. BND7]
MLSDSEFPFALLLANGVLAVLLALSVADVAALTGRSVVEAAAILVAVPLVVGLAVGTLARRRFDPRQFDSRRFAAVGVTSVVALVAFLEVTAVAVVANGFDPESVLIALVGSVLASVIARRRFGA